MTFIWRAQSVCERFRNIPQNVLKRPQNISQNGLKRPPGCSENVRKHSEISPNISVFTSFSYFLNMSNEYAYLLAQMAQLVAAQAERAYLLAQISVLQTRNIAVCTPM